MGTTHLGFKVCSKCREPKTLDYFYAHKTSGYQASCKDCSKVLSKQQQRKRLENESWEHRLFWSAYRHIGTANGKGAKLEFSITVETVKFQFEKQNNLCHWAKMPMDLTIGAEKTKYNPRSPSIDRIDNCVGYTPENIVITLWSINRMRGSMSYNEFHDFINEIVQAKTKKKSQKAKRPVDISEQMRLF
jgi:hypothetical protein